MSRIHAELPEHVRVTQEPDSPRKDKPFLENTTETEQLTASTMEASQESELTDQGQTGQVDADPQDSDTKRSQRAERSESRAERAKRLKERRRGKRKSDRKGRQKMAAGSSPTLFEAEPEKPLELDCTLTLPADMMHSFLLGIILLHVLELRTRSDFCYYGLYVSKLKIP